VGVRGSGAASVREAPHVSQNEASASRAAPQDGQAEARSPPQPLQKLASSRFSVAHDGQSTALAPQLRGPPVSVPVFE